MSAAPTTMTPVQAKALHDLMLATNPDYRHPRCAMCDDLEETTNMGDETYTAEQLQAKIDEATAPLVAAAVAEAIAPFEAMKAELEAMRAANAGSEIEEAVATATAPLNQQIADLNAAVDLAKTEGAAALVAKEQEIVSFLDQAVADKAAFDATKAERVQAVKDMEFLPDALIDEQADTYAALTDEAWTAKLAELESIKDNVTPAPGTTALPGGKTAFTATAAGGKPTAPSAASALIRRQAQLETSGTAGN